ncbi:HAD-like domain-containing protein [Truncatella angustata]|uniref:HAD-like domain-containing protein n=1 Tax=Truncatella angustata TaxID=152316 RepID=A0A9P8US50_9PEZI|nr:HAD-like domain-containing protein [Truncatella angustata]KAH6657311.1 HAD-like domain-containing protein [Truncatella angustata]
MTSSQYADLTSFKALSFDCYGTLIDWRAGFLASLLAVTSQLPPSHPFNEDPPLKAKQRFDELLAEVQETHPRSLSNELIPFAVTKLAHELGIAALPDGIAEPLGNAPGTFVAFPDTVAGLQKLKKYYKLAILSNIDNTNMKNTLRQLEGIEFDGVYTAQDVGSYKPNRKNFEYLFGHIRKELDVDPGKGEHLHVARSLYYDHVPCKKLAQKSAWISREADENELKKFEDSVAFEWRFDTIGKFADEVERQFRAKES